MTKALIIVDVQNDFCEEGSLPVAGGAQVAADITSYMQLQGDQYDVIVASKDWHPENLTGEHFQQFPKHCIELTDGSDFHDELNLQAIDEVFYKGQAEAGFSAFQGRNTDDEDLNTYLRERMLVDEVDVVGLATDYCVIATAKQALNLGYKTVILADLTAAVDPNSVPTVLKEFMDLGGEIKFAKLNDFEIDKQDLETPVMTEEEPIADGQ